MFDFHLHSKVSFDADGVPEKMVAAAAQRGMNAICFTDHMEYDPKGTDPEQDYTTEDYNAAYDHLHHPNVEIYRGMEFGMLPNNAHILRDKLAQRQYDFIIGSVHYVENVDIYYDMFWSGKTIEQAETRYFEQILACVQSQDDIDVLGHLTYCTKAGGNTTHRIVHPEDHRELIDEILRTLAVKGMGLEVNTSAVDRYGIWLPGKAFLERFKELGGEIVTVGSDAHNADRVGQHCQDACRMVADIFGYVCTFANRKPVFHKL